MDAHDFKQLPILEQWEYFWDNCDKPFDSWKGDDKNYYLYVDRENKDLYLELWMEHDPNGERGINALTESEIVRYMVPHEKAELPWV